MELVVLNFLYFVSSVSRSTLRTIAIARLFFLYVCYYDDDLNELIGSSHYLNQFMCANCDYIS